MAKTAQSTAKDSAASTVHEAAPTMTRGRRIQVRRSGVHGKGVFALQALQAGDFIVEYQGERISWKEAQRRHDGKDGDPNHTFYFQTEGGKVIDGGVNGNSSRWINHSCAPNCEAQEDDAGHVFITALQPIEPGEELFYDYMLEIDEFLTDELKEDYACFCGSPQCRGTMLLSWREEPKPPKKAKSTKPKKVAEATHSKKTAKSDAATKPAKSTKSAKSKK